VAFLVTALLFWWPIVRPAPRLHSPAHPGFEILYLLAATAQNTALGMFLTLSERSFYPYYDLKAARLGVSAVDEQAAAGGIMWVSGHMYILPILVLLYQFARTSAGGDVAAESEVDQ
jgi:cytochrome c oxidase assembly factor CtaG